MAGVEPTDGAGSSPTGRNAIEPPDDERGFAGGEEEGAAADGDRAWVDSGLAGRSCEDCGSRASFHPASDSRVDTGADGAGPSFLADDAVPSGAMTDVESVPLADAVSPARSDGSDVEEMGAAATPAASAGRMTSADEDPAGGSGAVSLATDPDAVVPSDGGGETTSVTATDGLPVD